MTQIYNRLTVSEVFYSIQGEGKTIGKPSYFIRLTGCNLMCGGWESKKDGKLHNEATWRCDSYDVWKSGKSMQFDELIEKMGESFVDDLREKRTHLIITGGEPLLHDKSIVNFVTFFRNKYEFTPFIEIETNATILPSFTLQYLVYQWNVSPKLNNSGMSKFRTHNEKAIKFFNTSKESIFKFVVSCIDDVNDIMDWIHNYSFEIQKNKIYLMPSCESREELDFLKSWLVDICKAEKFKYSHRLQIEIYNQKTGV